MRDNYMYTLRNKSTGNFLYSCSNIKDAKLYKTKTYLSKLLTYKNYSDFELVVVELNVK